MDINTDSVSTPFLDKADWRFQDENFEEQEQELAYQTTRCSDRHFGRATMLSMGFTLLLGIGIGYLLHNLTASKLVSIRQDTLVAQTFQEEAIYSMPPSNESNMAWESMIPMGRGFVQIQGGDVDRVEDGRYCVSVFHQLHCLDLLRHGYYEALEMANAKPTAVAPDNGPVSPIPGDFKHGKVAQHHSSSATHLRHCFDYLRQALMCAADSTLEKRNDSISGVRGWGVTHQCRKFHDLKEWTERHRYSDDGGITN